MKISLWIAILISVSWSALAFNFNDTTANIYNRLLDWAEHKYPLILTNGTDTKTLNNGTNYRCYSQNHGFCVGIRENNVLTYDGTIHDLGNTQSFIDQAQADGF